MKWLRDMRVVRSTRVAVAASLVLHAALLYAVASVTILEPTPRPERLTDAPGTMLTLAPPVVEPPPATPTPEPTPPPVEPPAASVVVTTPEPAPTAEIVIPVVSTPAPVAVKPVEALPPLPETPPPPLPASFAGVEAARASRIVYVIDVSAAMIPTFPYLKEELLRSLERLDPSQSYQIIAYRHRPPGAGGVSEPEVRRFESTRNFARATLATRREAERWLASLQPSGSSVPLTGLREALGLSPDLVFLLTSSIPRSAAAWGDGTAATLAALDSLNPMNARTGQRPAVIKAISLLHPDTTGLLPSIAREHGDGEGSYRVVGEASGESRR